MQPSTVSPKGMTRLKNREGCRLFAYKDAVGKWTIGFGRLMHPDDPTTCTKAQAELWFMEDLQRFVRQLAADVAKVKVPVAQHQFDALASFMYNIGLRAWMGSTARRDLLEGKLDAIPHELMRWVHGDHGEVIKGLVNRHASECDQFQGK